MARILPDRYVFDESGGGVTFSGGEPLMQASFLKAMLTRCREEDIHATVDTSGFAPFQTLQEVASLARLLLFDIKLIDNQEHLHFTGVPNVRILENLTKLCDHKMLIELRMPIIPEITDTVSNLEGVAQFIGKLTNAPRLRLLPHHHVAMAKYVRFGMTCTLEKREDPSDARMDELVDFLRQRGVDAFR